MLEQLISSPRLVERDAVELSVRPERVWERVRHGDLGGSSLVRALFAIRTLPERWSGEGSELRLRVEDLVSSPEKPGFQVLAEEPGREVVVGAIGKVFKPRIPFVHVANAAEFRSFAEPDYVKVAWALRVLPLGERDARLEIEVRVDATDELAWRKFRRYFRFIGPGSRFVRRSLLSALAREFGTPEGAEPTRALPGDELLTDAREEATDGVTIAAPAEALWPWLMQMGCRRGGFYSYDVLDNGRVPSARELRPELGALHVGQVIAATPEGEDGFEVLRLDAPRVLILGGLYDAETGRELPFRAERPVRYWQVTWAFVLEPLGEQETRLHVRARAAFSPSERGHALGIRLVHPVMQRAMLRNLAARAEGRLPRDSARDVLAGVGGAARMALALLTPFSSGARRHWGLDAPRAEQPYPGDELVREPRWGFTHAVEIGAPASAVWPWVAQIGADRGGFYSYQWLENLIGCELRNAERIHPEWQLRVGDSLLLHPKGPRLTVVMLDPGRSFVAHAAPDETARARGGPWITASWLFAVEPIDERRSRFISRFRFASSDDLATRLSFPPSLAEPVSFVMDRQMLLGVKERAERARAELCPVPTPR